jgi:replicative DNA helicase
MEEINETDLEIESQGASSEIKEETTELEDQVDISKVEESLLSIFIQDDDCATLIAQSEIREEHFLKKKNALLFRAALDVRRESGIADIDLMLDACKKITVQSTGETLLQFIGGAKYLTKILNSNASTGSRAVNSYIRVLVGQWTLQNTKQIFKDVVNLSGYDESKIMASLSKVQALMSKSTLGKRGLVDGDTLSRERFANLKDRTEHPERYVGIKTGFYWLDKYRAIVKQQTTVVAARTSVGKSTFVGNMAYGMMSNGNNVLIFTPELSKEEYTDRLICAGCHIPIDGWKQSPPNISTLDSDRFAEFIRLGRLSKLAIDDEGYMTYDYIIDSITKRKLNHPVDVVVVDYLQKLMYKGDNTRKAIDDAITQLGAYAKREKIAMIIVSQLKRPQQKAGQQVSLIPPDISDLKESGNIENFSDTVVLLHRPSITDINERKAGWYMIGKNREGPVTSEVKLRYEEDYLRFIEEDVPKEIPIVREPALDDAGDFVEPSPSEELNEQNVMRMINKYDDKSKGSGV